MNNARAENPTVVSVPGQPALVISDFDLAPFGYATEEFFVAGTASSYKVARALTADGHWNASLAETARYATRIVVIRPTDAKKFNGTVVVEWLNVSAGADGSPDWNAAHRELMRGGYAYVAVSAQQVGVEGGRGVMGMGAPSLKQSNPERYGRLSHPGDAFSYDIYSQVGRLLRGPDADKICGNLMPKRVIAMGESQSAVFLTTYVNAVDPIAQVYDGIFIHSRFSGAASLDNTGMTGGNVPKGVKLRTDLRVPVITVLAETDVLGGTIPGFHSARQPDNDRLRVWEIAGAAHADNYTFTIGKIDSGATPLKKLVEGYAPMAEILGMKFAKPMNNAPQHHYVVEAALWHLDQWLRSGKAPPQAMPLKLTGGESPQPALDANGNIQGGVRTPWVDVPTGRLSGMPNSGGMLGNMVGSFERYDAATLKRLYPGGKGEYLKKFEASLDAAVKAGFLLPADRKESLDLAAASYPGTP